MSSGADSGIFKACEKVVKVIRSTRSLPEVKKLLVAKVRSNDYVGIRYEFGYFVLDEETGVDVHSLNKG